MKKIDYWFLDFVAFFPNPLSLIIPHNEWEKPDFNTDRNPANLDMDQLVEALYPLFQDGFLLAITGADIDSISEDKNTLNELLSFGFIPSREQIRYGIYRKENSAPTEFAEEEPIYYFFFC